MRRGSLLLLNKEGRGFESRRQPQGWCRLAAEDTTRSSTLISGTPLLDLPSNVRGFLMAKRPCELCGTETSNRRFCSQACSLKGTLEQRARSLRKPKPACPQCGNPITTRRAKHCSRACADAARPKRCAPPCARCGSTTRSGRRLDQPYCSWGCWNEHRYESTGTFARWMSAWVAGKASGTLENGKPDARVRQALVLLRGQQCELCGWNKVNPVSGRVPLHVDHIDGDRSRNRPEDLRLLCPNCHSLTPTYQHLNNPKVRPIRERQSRRYREVWLGSTAS